MSSGSLAKLANLGPKSAAMLERAGIHTLDDLTQLGAVRAYLRAQQSGEPVSLNLLYALQGAIQNIHWQEVAKQQRESLLMELEALRELEG